MKLAIAIPTHEQGAGKLQSLLYGLISQIGEYGGDFTAYVIHTGNMVDKTGLLMERMCKQYDQFKFIELECHDPIVNPYQTVIDQMQEDYIAFLSGNKQVADEYVHLINEVARDSHPDTILLPSVDRERGWQQSGGYNIFDSKWENLVFSRELARISAIPTNLPNSLKQWLEAMRTYDIRVHTLSRTLIMG